VEWRGHRATCGHAHVQAMHLSAGCRTASPQAASTMRCFVGRCRCSSAPVSRLWPRQRPRRGAALPLQRHAGGAKPRCERLPGTLCAERAVRVAAEALGHDGVAPLLENVVAQARRHVRDGQRATRVPQEVRGAVHLNRDPATGPREQDVDDAQPSPTGAPAYDRR
jgi:hypothetical protein